MQSAPAEGDSSRSWSLDGLGVTLSTLCMIHCLAPILLPVVFSLAAIPALEDDRYHAALAVVLPAVALFAFQRGHAVHRQLRPALVGVVGVALVVVGAAFGDALGHHAEATVTVIGSLILTAAHLDNRRLLHRCRLPCCE